MLISSKLLIGTSVLLALTSRADAARCPRPASSLAATSIPFTCHPDATLTLTDNIPGHEAANGGPLQRVDCNHDVATYYDVDLVSFSLTHNTTWIAPFVTDGWKYMKSVYGGCTTSPPTTDSIGKCTQWGDPKPLLFQAHIGKHPGGTVRVRYDSTTQYRSIADIGNDGWNNDDDELKDIIIHELYHLVEGSSQGVNESPAYSIWGDSMWAQFCVFDFYKSTGKTALANRAQTRWMTSKFGKPDGAVDATWFGNWFYPLWTGFNGPQAMVNFFGLLAQHFPVELIGGKYHNYPRRVNIGEFVHFSSAAAGKNLVSYNKTPWFSVVEQ
ncbi:hypothetical protein DFS34DRAFT_670456 [Phlyctochytrium arcticum]|nr:hypothetical protein DFS34DRAFT_670456 [Phlyctochytrium arcticum]